MIVKPLRLIQVAIHAQQQGAGGTVVSLGFGTYLGLASRGANAIFGFLGGALSLLFWLYLMAMGLLLGAEVNSIIATRRGVIFEAVPRERLDRWVKRALRR